MKDPEPYLRQLGAQLTCPVHPEEKAVLDPDLRVWVNHEIYFVSSPEAKRVFLDDPLRYCGVVTDPVTGIRFRPGSDSPRFDYNARPFFFSSAATLAQFRTDPMRYAEPKRAMPPTTSPSPAPQPTAPVAPATQPAASSAP